jgi:hypothetical protein
MRTKALLIAAAALAVGIITSKAQVYSQNIVGYVNQPVNFGFNTIATPLDSSTGNSLTNLIQGIVSGAYDGSYVYIWNGAGYNTYYVDSSQGGLDDSGDNGPVPVPNVNPGTAYFFKNEAASNTVTYVGTVHIDGAGSSTNVVGVTTNTFGTGLTFVASKLPVGGGLNSVLELPTQTGLLDGDYIYVPNIVASKVSGFTTYYIDESGNGGNGISDAGDNGLVPEPIIPVGSGFFIKSYSTSPFSWVQSY